MNMKTKLYSPKKSPRLLPFSYIQWPVNSRKVYEGRLHDLSWTPVQRETRSSFNTSKSEKVQGSTAPEVRDIELFFFR